MTSINEPLSYYRGELRDAHAERVAAHFEELVKASGVDAEENARTIAELEELEGQHSKNKSQKNWWVFLRVVLWVIAIVTTFAAFSAGGWNLLWLFLAAGLVLIDLAQVSSKVSSLKSENEALTRQIEVLTDESWDQMEPLNSLFRWNLSKDLASQTFPDLQFDDHFSEATLYDMVATYGLDGSFNQGRSVLRTQSGSLNRNPFVFYRFLQHWIGSRSYQGSLVIYWSETVRNAQGQSQTVQRSQTLHASVTKAFPEFAEGAAVILGHEAAPNLSFSRAPSNLSGVDDTKFNAWRKSSALRSIEKQAKRELKTGSGQLTTMSNKEFETLFKALDRDHEIEFRLLFTPLAQQEMVALLNDKEVGHGDDFVFMKRGRTNYVEPAHLSNIDLDPNPTIFHTNDLQESRRYFNSFNVEFFRSLYFGMAPFLAIPLYTESRRLPVASEIEHGDLPNSWEVEVMANALGEENLSHPQSITRNLLTAEVTKAEAGGAIASINSLGYQGFDRVDFVPVLGGDGNWHQVPVPWVEYISVERNSKVFVARVNEAQDPTRSQGVSLDDWTSVMDRVRGNHETAILRAHLGAAIIG